MNNEFKEQEDTVSIRLGKDATYKLSTEDRTSEMLWQGKIRIGGIAWLTFQEQNWKRTFGGYNHFHV